MFKYLCIYFLIYINGVIGNIDLPLCNNKSCNSETNDLVTNVTVDVTIAKNEVLNSANKHLIYPNKLCADIKPLMDIFDQKEQYALLMLLLPENLQIFLLENVPIITLCLLSLTTAATFMFMFFFCLRKVERKKVNLNEAVLSLELKIQDLNFEKQTFTTKIIELEKDLADKQLANDEIGANLCEIKASYLFNEENDRKTIDLLNAKYDTLLMNFASVSDSERTVKKENEILKAENKRIELENLSLIETVKNTISIDKYDELMVKMNNMQDELKICEQNLSECKRGCGEYEKRVENLQNELNLRVKSNILQDAILKTTPSLTISKDESCKDNNLGKMDLESLQNTAKSLEQQLRDDGVNESTKEKLEMEIQDVREESNELKLKNHELNDKIKEYEIQLKLINELRKKDLELNVKAFAELDTQLKKKSCDAEKATHLLEQLKLKQERVQELETQVARIEKSFTNERQTFEKQAHENWLTARKYEKETKEAKQEAKIWKEKYNEIEQYKESTLIRPLPINKGPSSAFIQPIASHHMNKSNDSVDVSPTSKLFNESLVERERPLSSNSAVYIQPQQQQQSSFIGISQTPLNMPPHPLFMRGIPPPHMYRPPFAGYGINAFMASNMPYNNLVSHQSYDRNSTSSPDMASKYVNRMTPLTSVIPQSQQIPLLQQATSQHQSPSQQQEQNISLIYQNNDTPSNNELNDTQTNSNRNSMV